MFQSTRPMRGATRLAAFEVMAAQVSIHAPHAGRDGYCGGGTRDGGSFNPRAPCGARLATPIRTVLNNVFQSTRPMRGATAFYAAQ